MAWLVKWESAAKIPEPQQIEIIDVHDANQVAEAWVSFRYIGGDHDGCVAGAARFHIVMDHEFDHVTEVLAAARKSKTDAQSLTKAVRNLREQLITKLSDKERDITAE